MASELRQLPRNSMTSPDFHLNFSSRSFSVPPQGSGSSSGTFFFPGGGHNSQRARLFLRTLFCASSSSG
eukprot:Skav217404  [mRNA]  locus=scaffold2674:37153:39354:- [translate_table: standard]